MYLIMRKNNNSHLNCPNLIMIISFCINFITHSQFRNFALLSGVSGHIIIRFCIFVHPSVQSIYLAIPFSLADFLTCIVHLTVEYYHMDGWSFWEFYTNWNVLECLRLIGVVMGRSGLSYLKKENSFNLAPVRYQES